MALTSRGTTFTYGQVFTRPKIDQHPSAVYGTGFQLQQRIDVADEVEGQFTDGNLMFRLLFTVERRLFLQTHLCWRTSAGQQHESYAEYQLSRETVNLLENAAMDKAPEDRTDDYSMEEAVAAVIELIDSIDRFYASWRQVYPAADSVTMLDTVHDQYHRRAIVDLHARDVGGTWMLSYQNLTSVDPETLPKLHAWVFRCLDAGGPI